MGHILRNTSPALVGSGTNRAITLLDRGNQCGPTSHDCEPSLNNVGSGAIDVSQTHAPESVIVGRRGYIIASRTFN
jgi:hypothetical protein